MVLLPSVKESTSPSPALGIAATSPSSPVAQVRSDPITGAVAAFEIPYLSPPPTSSERPPIVLSPRAPELVHAIPSTCRSDDDLSCEEPDGSRELAHYRALRRDWERKGFALQLDSIHVRTTRLMTVREAVGHLLGVEPSYVTTEQVRYAARGNRDVKALADADLNGQIEAGTLLVGRVFPARAARAHRILAR